MRALLALVIIVAGGCDYLLDNNPHGPRPDAARDGAEVEADAAIDAPVLVDASVPVDTSAPDAFVFGTLTQSAYIKSAMSSQFANHFGSGIALSADGSRLAVSQANAVQIFTRSNSTWSYEATLSVSVDTVGTGTVLSLSGDGSRLAIGVFDITAFVYVRSGSTWTQEARLDPPMKANGDFFGVPIAISRDGATVVIGAYDENSMNVSTTGQTFTGAAHVFTRSGSTWSYRQRLLGANTEPGDYFGSSVTVNADGSTIAVGAWGERSNATNVGGNPADNSLNTAGAVYVFALSGGMWLQQAYVKPADTASQHYFGWSTSIDDTGTTLAVGAYYAGAGLGRAYVYTRNAALWSPQATLTSPNPDMGDMFGSDLSISADGNTLALGAPGESSAGSDPADDSKPGAGAAYLMTRTATTWSHAAYLKASNADPSDSFGNHVALSGTGAILAVSSFREASNATGINGDQLDNSVPYEGAVYAFQ